MKPRQRRQANDFFVVFKVVEHSFQVLMPNLLLLLNYLCFDVRFLQDRVQANDRSIYSRILARQRSFLTARQINIKSLLSTLF